MRCECHSMPYKKTHKVNDNITIPRRGNLPECVPTPKGGIQWPKSRSNHPRVPKPRLQQAMHHIRIVCTSIYRYHKQHQTDNIRENFTAPIKWMGQTLLHVASHQETSPCIHIYGVTNEWSGNTKGIWTVYKGKTYWNDQRVPKILMYPMIPNNGPSQEWAHGCYRVKIWGWIIPQKWDQ